MIKRTCSFILFLFALCAVNAFANDIVVYDASSAAKPIPLAGAKVEQTAEGLLIDTQGSDTQGKDVFPGVAFKGNWALDNFNLIELELIHRDNKGDLPVNIRLGGKNAGLGGEKDTFIDRMIMPKKGTYTRLVRFIPSKFKTTGMRKAPWDGNGIVNQLEGDHITSISIYMSKPLYDWKWGIKKITLKKVDLAKMNFPVPDRKVFRHPTFENYIAFDPELTWMKKTEKDFFPFIDVYGQYKYKEWPDKIHSDADLQKEKKIEAKDLAAHPGPKGWNQYGGWLDGPRFKATGHFRVEKIEGKWWMIDPEGCLYWSHGPVRVTSSSAVTPLDNREKYFENLPKAGSPFAQFYKTRDELLWPYYVKRNIQKTYDFSSSNVYRKYGKDWRNIYAEMAHKRLRSWGMNTVANSSDAQICLMNKTPYTDRIELKSPAIEGSFDGWWKFRDPFDPEFRANFRRQLQERKEEINNPWCFGFFVDNELSWGTESSLGEWTLNSPASQCAKIEFVKRLQKKYGSIEKLNAAWNGKYASWDSLLQISKLPPKGAKADCKEFSEAIVDGYYRSIREEFKKVAPDKLYLGCRFAGSANENFLRIGAKYCDALSFNIYRFVLDEFKLPEGIDLPILVGEFHFGALDRGMFHWTLIGVKNQKERGQAYYNYVESALRHPNFIGVHWHQFGEQPTTGRFDGENFQNGFLDVCDTPYWDTIEKAREIGYKMYQVRWGK
ncbi:MAG: beta-galactosidase [Planctomycetia bacterium]|nr:beta-galactosidase [Planctomycetia bacterium]